jgi:hypothetical protein
VEKTFASSASLSTELPALFFVPVAWWASRSLNNLVPCDFSRINKLQLAQHAHPKWYLSASAASTASTLLSICLRSTSQMNP